MSQGTLTRSSMSSTMSADEIDSASASYVGITLCLSTSGAMCLMSSGETYPRPWRNARALAAVTR